MAFAINAKLGGSFKSAFKAAQSNVSSLNSELTNTRNKSLALQSELQRLSQAYNKGQLHTESYKTATRDLQSQIVALKNKEEELIATQKRLNSQQAMKTKFKAYDSMRNAAGARAVQYGLAAYALAAPIKEAIKFESAMADVRKVVDFDTPQQFKEMNQDIINMSRNIPMAAEGLAKIVASGGQAGIAREELAKFAESAAKMGIAFDITADEAGDMMAKWRTAFKMGQDAVMTLANKINYLGNTTAASAPKISEVVTRIGPLGEVGGVASGEIAALGASMVGAGVDADMAATGIKNMILGLTAGTSATGDQARAFEELGLNAVDMAKYMQKDARGAILTVLDAIKKLDKEKQAAVLKDLFGKQAIGAIAPLLSNLEGLKDNIDKVNDAKAYSNSVDKEYEARAKTSENALQLLKNQTMALAIQTGSSLLPALNKLVGGLGWVMKGATWLADKFPNLTTGVVGVTLATVGLAAVFSAGQWVYYSVAQGVTALRIAYSMLKGVQIAQTAITYAATAAQWAMNAAMAVGAAPIWLIIAAVGALIGVGYLLVTNWSTVKAWFTTLWNDPKKAFQEFVDGVYNLFGGLFDWIGEKWNWIKSVFSQPIKANVSGSANAGGSSNGVSMGLASGGIFGKGAFTTWFAEDSPEAAIPIDGSNRSKALWAKTGKMLGMNSGGSMAVTYAPQIVVQGNGDPAELRRVMKDAQDDFTAKMVEYERNKRRLSYA